MSDPTTMVFSLNQMVLDQAIAAELPRLIKDLAIDYTSGRAPKGLIAQVTVNESMIRQAVTAYARKTVNPSFTHFDIQFQATRGEDGITANITASNQPIEADEASAAQTATRVPPRPAVTPAAILAAEVEPDEVRTDENTVKNGVADVAQDTGAAAPFETEATEDAAIEAPANVVEATSDPAATPAKPAAARSRLFADLKRPSNEGTAADE